MFKSRPRVLFVSYTADWTGPANSLLLLLKYLRDDYDVAVLLPGQGSFSEALSCAAIPMFSFPSLNKWSIPSIYRLIRRESFDLVYGNSTHGSSRNALIAAKLTRVPFICHVREMGWGKSWKEIGFLRFPNSVVAVSQACADSIRRFVPTRKLQTVHNGVPLQECQKKNKDAKANLLAETGGSHDDLIVLSMAHLLPRKGQEYAVTAMAKVVAESPLAHLYLVGGIDRDPAYVAKVRSKIQEFKLQQNLSVLGFRQDTSLFLQGADLYLHNAIKDPHPRSVIEAMAAGLPVVAFDVDGVSETVLHGKTGYLVPPGDVSGMAEAILKLASDPSLRETMGQAGRDRVETHFSAAVTAEKVARIIDRHLHTVSVAARP